MIVVMGGMAEGGYHSAWTMAHQRQGVEDSQ